MVSDLCNTLICKLGPSVGTSNSDTLKHLIMEFQYPLGSGLVNSLLKLFVFGDTEDDMEDDDPASRAEKGDSSRSAPPEVSTTQYYGRLILCIAGLQGSYLTWGVLQVIIRD